MISVKDVRAGYGGGDILHGVSFDVEDGRNLSIIGPNGCGKTTLLRALAGTLPFSGEVLIDGASIKKIKRRPLAKKIAMLSQTSQLYFNYTVFEIVMMGRYAYGRGFLSGISHTDKIAVESALKTVGMLDLKDRETDTLSGGQLQKVFLAKIIAQNPDIILLDEPTNHLDLSYQVELIRFLNKWAEENSKTVIGVLHDINLAMLLSERILLMDEGNVKACGTSRDVLFSDALKEAYKMDIPAYMQETLKKWEVAQ